MVIGTCARHRAACRRVRRRRDGIAVQAEVRYVCTSLRHSKAEREICGNLHTLLGPVDEGVARVDCRSQSAGLSISKDAGTRDVTSSGGIRRCGNFIAIHAEICHVCTSASNSKAISGRGGNFNAVLRPIDKGIARIGCDRQSTGFSVVVVAGTRNDTTSCRITCSRNGVIVQAKVGHVRTCLRHCEAVGGVGGNLHTTFCPIDKGIACIGRGRQSRSGTMVIGIRTSHRAACRRVRRNRNRVTVQAEVGHVCAGSCDGKAIGGVGGNHHAALRPVDEGVACVGRSLQGGRRSIAICARTSHRATRRRIGGRCDGIAVQDEVGHVCTSLRHCEAVGGVGGNLHTIFCPIDKGIACIGRGRQSRSGTMVIGIRTSYRTTCRRVRRNRNRVTVQAEVSNVCTSLRHSKAVGGVGGNHHAVLRPIDKGIARIGSSLQSSCCTMVIGIRTSHRATCRRVRRNRNRVTVQAEVGHVCAGSCDGKAIGGVGGNHHAALRPIDKGVACVGRSLQSSCRAVVIGIRTSHRAACRRVGGRCDGVTVQAEVGHVCAGSCDSEAIGGVSGNHHAALGPVDEGIARVGSGRQSGCRTMVIGIRTSHRTTCRRIRRNRDGIAVQAEMSHIITGSSHCCSKAIACRG